MFRLSDDGDFINDLIRTTFGIAISETHCGKDQCDYRDGNPAPLQFSPSNQNYELEIQGDYLLSPLPTSYNPWMSSIQPDPTQGNLTLVQSNPGVVRGLAVNQWSMQSIVAETSLDEVDGITSDLTLEGQHLRGSITNHTGFHLSDVIVILNHNFIDLGDLAQEETKPVDLAIIPREFHRPTLSWQIFEERMGSTVVGVPNREQEFKRMIMEAVIDQQNAYSGRINPGEMRSAQTNANVSSVTILGWIDDAPPDVSIDGQPPRSYSTGLYKTQADYGFPEEGEIELPAGLIPGFVSEMPVSAGLCGPEATSIWLDKGEAVIEFLLPSTVEETHVLNLQLMLQSDIIGNTPTISIYNWETDSWDMLNKSILGLNQISEPQDFINPAGLIRFQISVDDQDFQPGSCIYLGLGLVGAD